MYCELKNKEVQLIEVLPVRDSRGNVVKRYYKCTGCEIDIGGMKVTKQCDMVNDDRCLLKKL